MGTGVMGGHQPHVFAGIEYFARIDACDAFVVSDDVQFNPRDWQNRNRVKAPFGTNLLTVPVTGDKDVKLYQKLLASNVRLDKIWKTIEQSYSACPYWKDLEWLGDTLNAAPPALLVDLACPMIERFCAYLGIRTDLYLATELAKSKDISWPDDPSEKIAMQVEMLGLDTYAFGRGANAYMDPAPFRKRSLTLRPFVWTPPKYRQRWTKDGFVENLSIIDLIANEGPGSLAILRASIRVGDGEWGSLDTVEKSDD